MLSVNKARAPWDEKPSGEALITALAKCERELAARERELAEARRREAATAAVINVISRSKVDVDAVLTALTDAARTLCGAAYAAVYMRDGALMRLRAQAGLTPKFIAYLVDHPIDPATRRGERTHVGLAALTDEIVEIEDAPASAEFRLGDAPALGNFRAALGVPLLRDGRVEGVFGLARPETGRFPPEQIELVKAFAGQAVIAIENARLFDEVQARTENLRESLAQQTAIAEVLKVIGSAAFDLKAVFEAVAENSVKLCGADRAVIYRFDGEVLRLIGSYNASPEFAQWVAQHPIAPGRDSTSGRAALERRTIQILDIQADPEYSYGAKDVEPIRTVLGVPIMRGDELLGVITIYRFEIGAFSVKQVGLVETFADQAAIAIENARLFNETKEALERETATSEILKVIAASPSDTAPVFEVIAQSANRLLGGFSTTVWRFEGEIAHLAAFTPTNPEADAALQALSPSPIDEFGVAPLREGEIVQIPETEEAPQRLRDIARLRGYRAMLFVPLVQARPSGSSALPARSRARSILTTWVC
jgi:GAF domain-containing protein